MVEQGWQDEIEVTRPAGELDIVRAETHAIVRCLSDIQELTYEDLEVADEQ